ncbi:hypothetical protein DN752_22885 [Echinicola strongylocentroti]|uniref:SGNH hydrolase-type esterase domain-containing protein n=2 Tax=Echinicola strongylocentroti TaxID=1795355 RepID=A0A2Z4IPL9_9BACT|nr:hypothetical protein DN752_22885 [Echinicola strongylocentroti]
MLSAQPVISQSPEKWINAGVSGNTSVDLLDRLDRDVLSQHPDWVVMMVGTNDMLNSSKMVDIKDYRYNLTELTKRMLSAGIEVILMSPPPVDTTYLFLRHSPGSFQVSPNAKIDTVKQLMQATAKREGCGFFDLNQQFTINHLPQHNKDSLIRNENNSNTKDGVHLTSLGYRFVADGLYEYLAGEKILLKGS